MTLDFTAITNGIAMVSLLLVIFASKAFANNNNIITVCPTDNVDDHNTTLVLRQLETSEYAFRF